MQLIESILPYTQIVLCVVLVLLVLLQSRGAGAGGAFGGGDGFGFGSRRGAEKIIFTGTVVVSVLFVMLAIVGLLIK